MMAFPLAVLLLQASFAPTPRQAPSSSTAILEGVVLQAGSGEPLPRAQITLVVVGRTPASPDADSVAPSRTCPAASTGVDGKFVFRDIAPGSAAWPRRATGMCARSTRVRRPGPSDLSNARPVDHRNRVAADARRVGQRRREGLVGRAACGRPGPAPAIDLQRFRAADASGQPAAIEPTIEASIARFGSHRGATTSR